MIRSLSAITIAALLSTSSSAALSRYTIEGTGSGCFNNVDFADREYSISFLFDVEDFAGGEVRMKGVTFDVTEVGNGTALIPDNIAGENEGLVKCFKDYTNGSSTFMCVRTFDDFYPLGVPFPEEHGLWVLGGFGNGIATSAGTFRLDQALQSEVIVDCELVATCTDADFADDGEVGFDDLTLLLANWGSCGVGGCSSDLTFDGEVGFADLVLLLTFWGPCT